MEWKVGAKPGEIVTAEGKFIGFADSPEWAARIVWMHNEALAASKRNPRK